jgi:hypothetical protein
VAVAVLAHFMELAVLVALLLVQPVLQGLVAVEWVALAEQLVLMGLTQGVVEQALETTVVLAVQLSALLVAAAVLVGLVGLELQQL